MDHKERVRLIMDIALASNDAPGAMGACLAAAAIICVAKLKTRDGTKTKEQFLCSCSNIYDVIKDSVRD